MDIGAPTSPLPPSLPPYLPARPVNSAISGVGRSKHAPSREFTGYLLGVTARHSRLFIVAAAGLLVVMPAGGGGGGDEGGGGGNDGESDLV